MRRVLSRQAVKKNPPGRPPSKDTAANKASKMPKINFGVTPRDDEIVECSICGNSSTFRQFRFHNLEYHYNLAKTIDDTTEMDHKYFVRKLQEMGKLLKITTFFCPHQACDSSYKSALGLAFHLETCGKTREEIAASLSECEICHKKYTLSNLKWHKRTVHTQKPKRAPESEGSVLALTEDAPSVSKRKSAIKAREYMKEITEFTTKTDSEDKHERISEDRHCADEDFSVPARLKREAESDDENWQVTPSIDFILGCEEIKLEPSASVKAASSACKPDFSTQVSKYMEVKHESSDDPWDTPIFVTEDPLISVITSENLLVPSDQDVLIREFLPKHEQSVMFNTQMTGKKISRYERLSWFEGQTLESSDFDFISFTGGPVSAMAWHPSGKFLAISTLHKLSETPNLMESKSRRSSIQIYSQAEWGELPDSVFSLTLVLGLNCGYINHLQWSSFYPECLNPEHDGESMSQERIGYLCLACEDGSCRILGLRLADFKLSPTFASNGKDRKNVPVYVKTPEITLSLEVEAKISSGQCTRFDWDETNRYVVAGYASGHVSVFDLYSSSKLIRTNVVDDKGNHVVNLSPIWLIRSHISPVTAVVFDPKSPRYFYSGSIDRTLRTWDLELRQEMECKKVGCVIDMCWIRGWIHLGVCVDAAVSNPGAPQNYLRYYAVGSSQGRPNLLEHFNVTSTSFFEGMTLCGTEHGRITISYYDSFWRECDYDRNKKKKNVINIGKLKLDPASFKPIPFATRDEEIMAFPEDEEPKIMLNFCRERCHGQGAQEKEPNRENIENFYRFNKFVRINKVCWSPGGNYLTIGYRNGLFAIIPVTFDKLFT